MNRLRPMLNPASHTEIEALLHWVLEEERKKQGKNSFTFDASASPNGHDGIRGIQQQEQLQEENEVEEEPVPTTKKRKRKYGDDDCDGRKLVGDAKDLHSKTSKILEVYNHHKHKEVGVFTAAANKV